MQTRLNPYIGFKDNAREAIEFYHSVFGGKLEMDTFGENGVSEDPAEANKLMHAMITTDNGLVLMAADTPNSMEFNEGSNISISLSGDNDEELSGYFEKLSDGGTVVEPLVTAPWGDKFGMLTDKIGIKWMVNISAAQ